MGTPALVIKAFLNPQEGGCNYSKHFREHWIENKKLHHVAMAIPVEVTEDTVSEPWVELQEDGSVVWTKRGNNINPATLQEFIIENYAKKNTST